MIGIFDIDTHVYELASIDVDKPPIDIFDNRIKKICNHLGIINFILVMQGSRNFRNSFDPDYKKHRPVQKPKYYRELREHIKLNHHHIIANNLETDDICSIMATYCESISCPYVLIHIDKDLNQIPGLHYNYKKVDLYTISNDEALYNLSYQIIKGDTTDSKITGLRGYGDKKTTTLLKDSDNYLVTAFNEYINYYGLEGVHKFYITYNIVKLLTVYPKLIKKIQKLVDQLCST